MAGSGMKCRGLLVIAVGAMGSVLASPAQAHLVTTGLGPFYDGITHLLVSPSDILVVLGLGLLAGLGGAERGRAVVAALPVAWVVGGLVGFLASDEVILPLAIALTLLAVGILVAANVSVSRTGMILLAAVAGLVFGGMNGSALVAAGTGSLGLVGIVAAAAVILFLVTAAVISARAPWQQIVVRVAGSWIAAIAILMLGRSLAG